MAPPWRIYGRKHCHTRRKAGISRSDVHPEGRRVCVGKPSCTHFRHDGDRQRLLSFRKGLGTNDTLRLIAPFDENLYGVETRRIIGTTIQPTFRLQSSMALLRIVCEGDDLRDRLDGITLIGDDIYTEGGYQPYTGRWFDKKPTAAYKQEVRTAC